MSVAGEIHRHKGSRIATPHAVVLQPVFRSSIPTESRFTFAQWLNMARLGLRCKIDRIDCSIQAVKRARFEGPVTVDDLP